jgi:hypothetical protein
VGAGPPLRALEDSATPGAQARCLEGRRRPYSPRAIHP